MIYLKLEQSKLAALFFISILFLGAPVFGSTPNQLDQIFQSVPEQSVLENTTVSYIYVDSNEDGAGGGHTALRIGDVVFHFQRSLDGFFMLDRSPWDGFRYTYSRIENRNITETYLKMSESQKRQLLSNFTAKSMRHRLLIKKYRELVAREDRLTQLRNTGKVDAYYPVLRYYQFEISQENSDYLPGDIEEIEFTLEGYMQHGLNHGFKFQDDQFIATEFNLPSVQVLSKVESKIKQQSNQLLQTDTEIRPDRARTFLELQVLLEAIRRSRNLNRLVIPRMVILVEDQNQKVIEITQKQNTAKMRPNSNITGINQSQSTTDVAQDPKQILINNTRLTTFLNMYNQRLTNLEKMQSDMIYLINRLNQSVAIIEAAEIYDPIQLIQQGLIIDTPSLSATISRSFKDVNKVNIELKKLRIDIQKVRAELEDEFSYSLLKRNCVTLLLTEVEKVVKLDLPLDRPITTLIFVPMVSNYYIQNLSLAGDQFYYRSFRNDYLNWLKRQKNVNSLNVINSESSTISSYIYSFNRRDSAFLFFTEDQLILKPVLGLANLGVASIQIMVGLFYFPIDHGHNFSNGVRGFSYSITEIGGLSIRKGTFRTDHKLFYSFPTIEIKNPIKSKE